MNKGYFDDLSIIAVFDKSFSTISFPPVPCLENYYSVEMISDGEVFLQLDDKKILLRAPVIFWLGDKNRSFQFTTSPDVSGYRHLWVDFSGERGKKIYEALWDKFQNPYQSLTPELAAPIQNTFLELCAAYRKADGYNHNALVAKIEVLMSQILSSDEWDFTEGDLFQIYEAYQYFIRHPAEKHDLPTIASERGISEVYFRKLFRERFGIPVGKFLLKLRMEYAADLLYTKKYRVNEVADICGFADAATFTHRFVKFFGASPSFYLKKKRLSNR